MFWKGLTRKSRTHTHEQTANQADELRGGLAEREARHRLWGSVVRSAVYAFKIVILAKTHPNYTPLMVLNGFNENPVRFSFVLQNHIYIYIYIYIYTYIIGFSLKWLQTMHPPYGFERFKWDSLSFVLRQMQNSDYTITFVIDID